MNETIKTINSKNFDVLFTQTEDKTEFFSRLLNFGGVENIEFSIDLERYFNNEIWGKLPHFIDFLESNLKLYIEKAIIPLTTFAQHSGYFKSEETQNLKFEYNHTIIILDNTFSIANRWNFELDFAIQNMDPDGRWFVTFDGNCISGIRREFA